MNPPTIPPELKAAMKRLRLGRLIDTLPERLSLAKGRKLPHLDFLLLILADEVSRRDSAAAAMRATKAHLDPSMTLEQWDDTAKISYDRELLAELTSLRFLDAHAHVCIVGPVGVGKTFLAHALGHAASRRGRSVLAVDGDKMLKSLRHARLDGTHEQELRQLTTVDLLLVDDFGLDAMTADESRDIYEIISERHRCGSLVLTSNRGPDEWLATFADPMRGQAAIDRFHSNAYDLVIDGESYRKRQKPSLDKARSSGQKEATLSY